MKVVKRKGAFIAAWIIELSTLLLVAQIEEEKRIVDKEREEMLANFEKHKELERQQQEKIRKV